MQDLGHFDIAIIGGGINGAGIARDAAGRGLKVLLVEKGDLAEGTSSRSGKLVHGGLRYLEYYEFRLVREALIEREVLLAAAPHIIWPMRFVLPHSPEQRPAWLVRLGLVLYDSLGGRKKLPRTRKLDLRRAPEGKAIREQFRTAFEYSDCWVDDARLVVLNAIDARDKGATVLTRTAARMARRENGVWRLQLAGASGSESAASAGILVNAAGPWVEDVIERVAGRNSSRRVRLVKGSHIITRKFWEGPQAYLLQSEDRRVIFVNPYEDDLALIGTTDIPYSGAPEDVAIDEDEIGYLLRIVNRYMRTTLGRGDVVTSFSGVRPLYDDNAGNPSAVTRDYVFDVEDEGGKAPLLSIFGGKITTYRKLAEHAMKRLGPYLDKPGTAWTSSRPLPGGDLPGADFDRYLAQLRARYDWLPPPLAEHYARLYGTRAEKLIDGARGIGDLGRHFGASLYEREADFLRAEEWATTPDDILDRRTKHGLHLSTAERGAFAAWMTAAPAASPMRRVPDARSFLDVSTRIGADPALVQGPGGNTSMKHEGTLWVKASGTLLADALSKDIMVPVRLGELREAIRRDDPACESCITFVPSELNPRGLRPSIETTLHALMPQRVVMHVHCVETIAWACLEDAEDRLRPRLEGLPWALVPYARPGLPLTRQVAPRVRPGTAVLVLANHGLVVGGDSVGEAEHLLREVQSRLRRPVAQSPRGPGKQLPPAAGYLPATDPEVHALARDPLRLQIAARGSLYPDHVIFLGPGVVVVRTDESLEAVLGRMSRPVAPLVLVAGAGALLPEKATPAAQAMARCLADVTARITAADRLRYLTEADEQALLNWDAEKYRQAMARRAS